MVCYPRNGYRARNDRIVETAAENVLAVARRELGDAGRRRRAGADAALVLQKRRRWADGRVADTRLQLRLVRTCLIINQLY